MKIKKILAGVVGIGLIVLLLLFVNSFVGNPVSKALAKKAAQQYIHTNYNNMDLEIQKCAYNFKFSSYYVFVQSSTSEDTAFSIYANSFGKILRDDYKYEVANNFTTFRRLDEEMRKLAEEMIGGKLDYDFDYTAFSFDKASMDKEDSFMKLERDMKLDIHHPPLPLTAYVVLFSDDVSYHKIAEAAKAIEGVLKEQDVPIVQYSVRILPLSEKPKDESQAVSWVNSLSVSDFPAEKMTEENLPQVMEQFEINRENELNKTDKK